MGWKICSVINNSAADSRILLKFGTRMHYETPQAAGIVKSISGQIHDGGRPPNFNL